MKIKLKNINSHTKELTCTVPWEDLKDSFQDEFNKMKANHTPQGGRKGKVFGRDLELFKRNYGAAIEANFAEKSLNVYYSQAMQKENLNPINQAQVSNLDFSEGKEFYVDEYNLKKLQDNEQITFKYSSKTGDISNKYNPNGSIQNIAGIVNKKKNVLGLMPHPERAIDKFSSEDGISFFKGLSGVI